MNIALRVPDSLGINLKTFSKKENVSMNQFIATAIAEKMSSLQTYDYLEEKSKEGSCSHFKSMLKKVPSRDVLIEEDSIK
ncbi:MAG: toxin-antitoxin system HicB family antitoxin [Campylobacterota bacterium]|nr:toxin-antitoxin system HicB family antitoxin [Campylobacterota bacterium]